MALFLDKSALDQELPFPNFLAESLTSQLIFSKSASRDDFRKASYPRTNNLTKVEVEPRSCNHGRRKKHF